MTKIFRIYLGLNNPQTDIEYCQLDVINLVKKILHGATIYSAQGIWRRKVETTLVIETLEDEFHDYNRIKNICKYLINEYGQDSVLLMVQDVNVEFINSREF